MKKVDCTKCKYRRVCKIAGDPWNLKHGGDEKGWCPVAQDAVDGKETGREIAISDLGLSQTGEAVLMSKKMQWEHPIMQARWSLAKKIRYLMDHQYSDDEICETLSMGDRRNYISDIRYRKYRKQDESKKKLSQVKSRG